MGLIIVHPVKRRRKSTVEDASRKQASVSYTLPTGDGNIAHVCKVTFMEVFGITRRRTLTLVTAKKSGEVVYVEKRGNKVKNRKYTEEDEQCVITHINAFPRDESHYSRARSSKEYLSQDLSINSLYKSFKLAYPDKNISHRFYFKTFKSKFPNLSFKTPRTDTCSTCDLLNTEIKCQPGDNTIKKKLELHHRKAERSRAEMKKDHVNSQLPSSDTCTISIDLQQVLSIPALTHTQMYYLRQLSCYNLGIHVGDNNNVLLSMWHEAIHSRGANEIASCLLKAVEANIMCGKKKLIVWSDNCSGQNKNQMLIYLWLYLIAKGYLDEVNHKFLIVGHSYLSCDRDFALIERKKKKAKCEVPLDLVRVMVEARDKNPFTVRLMQPEDFFDFKTGSRACLNTKKLEISKVQWLCLSKDRPEKVLTKAAFSELEEFHEVNVFKKGVTMDTIVSSLKPLPPVNGLSEDKKKDLKSMIPYLKSENREFFEDILK